MKKAAGEQMEVIHLQDIHGQDVYLPGDSGRYIHLQFRRFSGCPICNMHLQEFIRRKQELDRANITEVVFFHSSKEKLAEYQAQFPFHVIADPQKKMYRQFGVEKSLMSILHPRAIWAAIKGNFRKNKPRLVAEGGMLGLPADLLIAPGGKIKAVYYGKHASDQWSMETLLALVKEPG